MRPLVIGHAAAAGEAPANTLAGVRACLAAAAEGMEIDVQLAADGVPVLMHDTTVDRTTNLRGPVRSFAAAELAQADAGEGEHVPTLAEVLALVDGRLSVMCELKSTPGDAAQDEALVESVLSVVSEAGAIPWCAVHSFSPAIVKRARTLEPRVPAALISTGVEGEALERLLGAALKSGAQAISVEHQSVTAALVTRAHQRQLTTWAWTSNTPEGWDRLIGAGTAGIITNVPTRLRAHLSS